MIQWIYQRIRKFKVVAMEKIEIDKNSGTPLYLQLARQLEQQAADGILVPGERLLSEVRMAEVSGLSVGRVKKAYTWLQDRGGGKVLRISWRKCFQKCRPAVCP